MTINEGNIDRIVRIVVGLALIAWTAAGPQEGGRLVGWIGLLPLITGIIGFCPAYHLFGVRTCPLSDRR